MTQKARLVGLPLDSAIARLYHGADLADAFAIALPDGMAVDIAPLARLVLAKPSRWFRALLACRDTLVVPFGIKTSAQLRMEMREAARQHIDFFPIISSTQHELIIGADDSHLDFRTSVLIRQSQQFTCLRLHHFIAWPCAQTCSAPLQPAGSRWPDLATASHRSALRPTSPQTGALRSRPH